MWSRRIVWRGGLFYLTMLPIITTRKGSVASFATLPHLFNHTWFHNLSSITWLFPENLPYVDRIWEPWWTENASFLDPPSQVFFREDLLQYCMMVGAPHYVNGRIIHGHKSREILGDDEQVACDSLLQSFLSQRRWKLMTTGSRCKKVCVSTVRNAISL